MNKNDTIRLNIRFDIYLVLFSNLLNFIFDSFANYKLNLYSKLFKIKFKPKFNFYFINNKL